MKIFYLILSLTLPFRAFSQKAFESDSLVLVEIYHSLNGPNWESSIWLDGPVKNWSGIKLNNEGRVSDIILNEINAEGEIPDCIIDLEQLALLRFLNGKFPEGFPKKLALVPSLKELYFYQVAFNQSFSFPVEGFDNLENLRILGCELEGELPKEPFSLPKLKVLSFAENQFTGPIIPPGALSETIEFYSINGNKFSGEVSNILGNLPNLKKFEFYDNAFSGEFPDWTIEVAGNFFFCTELFFEGQIPDNFLEKLGQEVEGFRIWLTGLSGNIEEWMIGPMRNFRQIELAHDNFSGKIPDGIFDVSEIIRFQIIQTNISGLPNFDDFNVETLNWFYVDNAKLGFHELDKVKHIAQAKPDRVRLLPQRQLLENDTIILELGASTVLKSGSYSPNDTYQWYKDGLEIEGATNQEFTLNDFSANASGIYHCVMKIQIIVGT